jgi:CHAD domain-containing protein
LPTYTQVVAIRQTVERELKLRASGNFRFPELGGEAIEPREFVSTYHDTTDHRLARRGVTLRHRLENGDGRWQLKLPQGRARLELEQSGTLDAPPADLVGLVAAYLRGEPLAAIATLRTRREGVKADGAEITHDSVAVLVQEQVTRSFDELEVELVGGDEKSLRRIERALRQAGAADAEFRPKVFQALDLDFAPPPEEAPEGTAATLRARLREQAEAVLAHDPGTRLGSDPEELHQMRVATRRLRAFLRAGRALLDPAWSEPLREELRWLGSALGPVRDFDVLLAHLRPEVEALGEDAAAGRTLLRALERQRSSARRRLLTVLRDVRYFALLDALDQPVQTVAEEPTLDEIHAEEHRKLRKAMNALGPDSTDAELHAARIKVKRARYAAELAGAGDYVKAAKALQDVLGDHQDAVVAQERLRAVAQRTPETAVAAGRLLEREWGRVTATRADWPDAWKRLKKTI